MCVEIRRASLALGIFGRTGTPSGPMRPTEQGELHGSDSGFILIP
jgi:hypothetical protein